MKLFRNYVFPIVIGAFAGMVALWAFDSFSQQKPIYFLRNFLQTCVVAVIVVVVINMARRPGNSSD